MANPFSILVYESNGHIPFEDDLKATRDQRAVLKIMRCVQRMELGNFGDHKSVGEGVWESRIDYGPGYRVYYSLQGAQVVLLLCSGNKGTQSKDIVRAKSYKSDYESR